MTPTAKRFLNVLAILVLAGPVVLGLVLANRSTDKTPTAPIPVSVTPSHKPSPVRVDPQPPPVAEVLQSGVLIVVSKGSQQMHVFKDGKVWKVAPVSTGRRGKATPSGVFPILEKRVFHRSNIYSNAPMPFMQRLTWSGIAIHAGQLPGYPASHGCIRMPYVLAKSLYALTRPARTTVIVTNEPIRSSGHAQRLALSLPVHRAQAAVPPPQPLPVEVAAAALPAPLPQPIATPLDDGETIQLGALGSNEQASAKWDELRAARPELASYRVQIIAAVVNARQVFRLRVSAPDAHTTCSRLRKSGVACFPVN